MKDKRGFHRILGYLGESRKYFYFVALVFLIGGILGFIFKDSLGFLDSLLNEIVGQISDLSLTGTILFIFKNNLSSALFAMLLGIFLGVMPLFNAIFNGVVVGYVLARASALDGWGVLFKLLPHGIFELPAIFIALGMGLRLGGGFLENYFSYHQKNSYKRFFGILALIIGFLGIIFALAGVSGILTTGSGILISTSLANFAVGAILLIPIVVLFFGDKKLRKLQGGSFIERFNQAVRVFVFVVLPLLAIAAIIEGALMFLYR